MFEIYKITCNVNNKVYIGITSKGIQERWKTHIQTAFSLKNKDSNAIFKKAIRKYKPENFTIEVIDIANSEQEAENKEIHYIKKYNSFAFDENSNGYNSTRGGDGARGYGMIPVVEIDIKTAKVINEYKSFAEAEKAYGRRINHVYDLDVNISTTLTTIFVHKEVVNNLTPEELKRRVYKTCNPIVQMDENGNLIDIWATVKQVVTTLQISQGNLSSALAGNRRLASGFVWMRYNDYIKTKENFKIRDKKTTSVKIGQYTIDGQLIKVYDSLTQAINETNIKHSAIIDTCKGNRQSAGGFVWKYESNNFKQYNKDKVIQNKENRRQQMKEVNQRRKNKQHKIIDITTGEKFYSINEISQLFAIDGRTIRSVLNNEREEYKGHKWQYIK